MPAFLRRMIPALIGAAAPLVVLEAFLLGKTAFGLAGLALESIVVVATGILVAVTSRRSLEASDTLMDELRIQRHPERMNEFRLGMALGYGAMVATALAVISLYYF
ncbi:hypothetical protein GCM10008956_05480 [Deinococcus arenae]|uniref:Uncharacterized protein n=1 Tax=Deinococcus arenae TaxID=1452751 RepID=A0A8H9GJ49_9DEIO|nr:sodium/proton-translocating pyrophosphatase [Deinococcus arenae]GGM32227.1 hypothetical protein GCM10008956_05480 [Deinococcus arenae]